MQKRDWLIKLRESKGFPVSYTAKALGWSPSTYRNRESGYSDLNIEHLQVVAMTLKVPLKDVVYGEMVHLYGPNWEIIGSEVRDI